MTTKGSVLELRELSRSFGQVVAVDRLSFRIERGEYVCLLGPSGCGKTTLLRLIAGFERPDSGEILLHGADVVALPPEKRDVNVVFQSYALFPHLTVAQNIAFGLRMKRHPRSDIDRRVSDALSLVRLEREAGRLPSRLSGGQQQRVALARALVNRPALLLLDEPLSALDEALRQQMQSELRRVQKETGVAFLHITHDQQEALSLADRVGVMRGGRFEQIGLPRDVYEHPASAFVASFVGGANILAGRMIGTDQVELDAGGRLKVLPGSEMAAPDGRVVLAIRPETLRFSEPSSDGVLAGEVTDVTFRGADIEYRIQIGEAASPHSAHVRVLNPARRNGDPTKGDRVTLAADAADWVVLPPAAGEEAP